MITCPDCGQEMKSPQGLASHRRSKHSDSDGPGPNLTAARRTMNHLEDMGRLEEVDAAQVQAVLSIAHTLDLHPFNSQMWREYREALGELRADGDDDGGIEALLRELRESEVGDASAT